MMNLNSTTVSLKWPSFLLFFLWVLISLQGVFYETITTWVVERRFFIFRILPFYLYPSDLISLPLLVFAWVVALQYMIRIRSRCENDILPLGLLGLTILSLAIIIRVKFPSPLLGPIMLSDILFLPGLLSLGLIVMISDNFNLGARRRRNLLIGWWCILLVGVVNGFLHQNPDILADVRTLMLRPLVAVVVFFLVLLTGENLLNLSRWIVRFGLVVALYMLIASVLWLSGSPILPYSPLYGGIPLLLPYVVVLLKLLVYGEMGGGQILKLSFFALAILSSLAKPLIAAFLICNLLFFILTGKLSHRAMTGVRIYVAALLLFVVIFSVLLFALSGGIDTAVEHIAYAYLKKDMRVRDLSGGRFDIWRISLQRWAEQPFLGQGLGYLLHIDLFDLGHNRHDSDVIGAHNFLLEMLYKLGIGSPIILLLWIRWLRLSVHDYKSHSYVGYVPLHASVILFILTLSMMALYGSHVAHPISGFLLWFALGIETAISTGYKELKLSSSAVLESGL